jgi:ParB family chromosome partitioning protein
MKPMKKGLGKGLGALIPDEDKLHFGQHSVGEILELPIKEVAPNADQPRRQFADEAIQSLAESIRLHGVVQPILVSSKEDGYMIIAGERRWRAAQVAGLAHIPAIVKQVDDLKLAQISLIENIQREDLTDVEEAQAYHMLIEKFSLKQDEVADAVGKSRSYVANTLRLLKLEPSIQTHILEGKISGGHGRVLLRESVPENQLKWADMIIQKGISVRELEKLIVKPSKAKKGATQAKNERSYELMQFEQELKDVYGTKVMIQNKENKGKIEIEFYGLDEFDRIMKLLKK